MLALIEQHIVIENSIFLVNYITLMEKFVLKNRSLLCVENIIRKVFLYSLLLHNFAINYNNRNFYISFIFSYSSNATSPFINK